MIEDKIINTGRMVIREHSVRIEIGSRQRALLGLKMKVDYPPIEYTTLIYSIGELCLYASNQSGKWVLMHDMREVGTFTDRVKMTKFVKVRYAC